MRPISLSPVPLSSEAKLNWCIDAIQKIALASKTDDPNKYADAYELANVTPTRTIDADAATLDDVRNVLGSFIQDHKSRGSKR